LVDGLDVVAARVEHKIFGFENAQTPATLTEPPENGTRPVATYLEP
jgi:hypothetical protein